MAATLTIINKFICGDRIPSVLAAVATNENKKTVNSHPTLKITYSSFQERAISLVPPPRPPSGFANRNNLRRTTTKPDLSYVVRVRPRQLARRFFRTLFLNHRVFVHADPLFARSSFTWSSRKSHKRPSMECDSTTTDNVAFFPPKLLADSSASLFACMT